jgi:hypothetical protein
VTLLSNNALTLGVGIQTAKAAAQATPAVTLRYTGGYGPTPNRNTLTLAETDANRVQSDPVVVGYRVGGDGEHYVRPSEQHILAHLLLGHTVTTGAGPYVHTIDSTASGTAPYATLFRSVNAGGEVTEMVDAQIASITWRGGAGQALTCTVTWVGGGATTFGVTDPGVASTTDAALTYPQVTVTKNAVHDGSVASFELTANQNRTEFDGDSGLYPFDVAAGLYAVSGSLVMAFQSDADYRLFHTGSPTGTAPSTTLGAQPLTILAAIDATHSVAWNLTNIFLTTFEAQHGTDGAPLTQTMSFQAKHDATIANVLQMVVKNAVALP